MREQTGEKLSRVVRLQPRALVGRQRERGTVRFAEAERTETFEHFPDAIDIAVGELALTRGRVNVCLRTRSKSRLNRRGRFLHRATQFVCLGERDAHGFVQDAQHVLVIDDHPVAVLQKVAKARVQVVGLGEPVFRIQKRGDHVSLHRTRPEERDISDEVVVFIRLHLADEFALSRAFDLEHAERVRRANRDERGLVVVRDGVEFNRAVGLYVRGIEGKISGSRGTGAVYPLNLTQCVRERRLHAHTKYVEFEQPHVVGVVFVELTHRQAGTTRLHRRDVVEVVVAQNDTTRMHRHVPGESVESLSDVDEQVESVVGCQQVSKFAQLGATADLLAKVTRVESPDVLRNETDLVVGQPECEPGVSGGTTCAIRVLHRHQAHAGRPVAFEYRAVDVVAPRRLHVDVNVGQGLTFVAQEALEQ